MKKGFNFRKLLIAILIIILLITSGYLLYDKVYLKLTQDTINIKSINLADITEVNVFSINYLPDGTITDYSYITKDSISHSQYIQRLNLALNTNEMIGIGLQREVDVKNFDEKYVTFNETYSFLNLQNTLYLGKGLEVNGDSKKSVSTFYILLKTENLQQGRYSHMIYLLPLESITEVSIESK